MLVIVLVLVGLILSPINNMLGIEIIFTKLPIFKINNIINHEKVIFYFFKFQNIYSLNDIFHLILPFLIYLIFEFKYSSFVKLVLLGFAPFSFIYDQHHSVSLILNFSTLLH